MPSQKNVRKRKGELQEFREVKRCKVDELLKTNDEKRSYIELQTTIDKYNIIKKIYFVIFIVIVVAGLY